MSDDTKQPQHNAKAARQQRLKQALRDNLRRRKSQLKAREDAATVEPAVEQHDSRRG